LYLEKLFDLLGIADQLNKKTTRYVGSAQVLEHIISGKGIEIGLPRSPRSGSSKQKG